MPRVKHLRTCTRAFVLVEICPDIQAYGLTLLKVQATESSLEAIHGRTASVQLKLYDPSLKHTTLRSKSDARSQNHLDSNITCTQS